MDKRHCRYCQRPKPPGAFNTAEDTVCSRCREKVERDKEREKQQRLDKERPPTWGVVCSMFKLDEQEIKVIKEAVNRYGLRSPCPDEVIQASINDPVRQCELLSVVTYSVQLERFSSKASSH